MKHIIMNTITWEKENREEAWTLLEQGLEMCGKIWPEYDFFLLAPGSGPLGRALWVEVFPSQAAHEEWMSSWADHPEFGEIMQKFMKVAYESVERFSLVAGTLKR